VIQGFNPLRWNCDGDGCFNKKRRPKIEVFAVCFPGRINFGDVDGLVEINGYFCLLEWKGDGGKINTRQRISFEQFTLRKGNIVFVVNGDAETMEVHSYCTFFGGQQKPSQKANLDEVMARMSGWAKWNKRPLQRCP
jgi:hypothetical protein